MKNRNVKFLPCSVVCHGESEVILAKQLQNNKRRNLNVLSEKNGKQTIMINTINKFLDSRFPTIETYISENRDLLQVEKYKILNHKIFTIMDKDDKSDELFESYKNKSLFNDFWWGAENLIEPIYFVPNMDVVFSKHGFPIDSRKKKPFQYLVYLTVNFDDVIVMLKNLKPEESNINIFLDYIDKMNE